MVQPIAGNGEPSSEDEGARPVVLVVEDEPLIRDGIATFLRDAGCLVLEADSPERAIGICHSGAAVDVIFVDVNLNGADCGWDVAEAFRKTHTNIGVLYTSGTSFDPARRVSGSRFFRKPYAMDEVLRACCQLSGHGHSPTVVPEAADQRAH